MNLGGSGGRSPCGAATVFYPRSKSLPVRSLSLSIPSEDMSQHCLLLCVIGQAAKVDFELLDPPASTSQVPGLGVRHPAQCDYAAFHRTAKYVQDESKLSPECLNPSL